MTQMNGLNAVIFDFDYTLGDSSLGIHDCINHGLTGLGFPPVSYKEACASIGKSLPDTLVQYTGEEHRDRSDEFYRLFMEKSMEVMVEKCRLYPGVPETVQSLRDMGFSLAIASTKHRHRIDRILVRYGLGEFFDVVVGGEDVSRHKPDPGCVQIVLNRLGVAPSECVYVGDNVVDAAAAEAAGLCFIGVLTGVGLPERYSGFPCLAVVPDVGHVVSVLGSLNS